MEQKPGNKLNISIQFEKLKTEMLIFTDDDDIKNRLDDLCENVKGFYPGEVYKIDERGIYAVWLALGKIINRKAR